MNVNDIQVDFLAESSQIILAGMANDHRCGSWGIDDHGVTARSESGNVPGGGDRVSQPPLRNHVSSGKEGSEPPLEYPQLARGGLNAKGGRFEARESHLAWTVVVGGAVDGPFSAKTTLDGAVSAKFAPVVTETNPTATGGSATNRDLRREASSDNFKPDGRGIRPNGKHRGEDR